MSFHEHDLTFMRLAIAEARKGCGKTAPNPIVGALIARDGTVLARGYHHAAGKPHAEIEVLKKLPSPAQARGATLYVTLEPCSTFRKTPPCTTALIESGFARVVYGATDPNPHHRGIAKQLLKQAGIEVTTGILEKECAALNTYWNHRISTGLPWVIAKCGISLDGRISSPPGERWITSEASRRDAMRLRSKVDAILVGGGTIRADNPALTVRKHLHQEKTMAPDLSFPRSGLLTQTQTDCTQTSAKQPWRIIWTRGAIPSNAQVLTDEHRARTLIFRGKTLQATLHELAERGINSVLIEGGGITLGTAFHQRLVDEVRFYIAPLILGTGTLALESQGLMPPCSLIESTCRKIGPDMRISGLVKKKY